MTDREKHIEDAEEDFRHKSVVGDAMRKYFNATPSGRALIERKIKANIEKSVQKAEEDFRVKPFSINSPVSSGDTLGSNELISIVCDSDRERHIQRAEDNFTPMKPGSFRVRSGEPQEGDEEAGIVRMDVSVCPIVHADDVPMKFPNRNGDDFSIAAAKVMDDYVAKQDHSNHGDIEIEDE